MTTYHHVERIIGYRAFFLMHIEGQPDMQWTPDDEQAFRYEDRDEAEQDATLYGGEVSTFESGFSSTPKPVFVTPIISLVPASEPVWRGHDSAARLQYREAERMEAAE